MTHVKALQAGHSSQGTSEPITPVYPLQPVYFRTSYVIIWIYKRFGMYSTVIEIDLFLCFFDLEMNRYTFMKYLLYILLPEVFFSYDIQLQLSCEYLSQIRDLLTYYYHHRVS